MQKRMSLNENTQLITYGGINITVNNMPKISIQYPTTEVS